MPGKIEPIPNQVFVGLPWKNVRRKYENAIGWLRIRSPLSFAIVGRDSTQDARDLLELIKTKIDSSSYAIFDATGGNANVSLEYGYAEARDVKRALYLSARKTSTTLQDQPIISDLAGKTRQHYKNETTLRRLLSTFSTAHTYTKRFEKFLGSEFRRASKGKKKRGRALALKIIHACDKEQLVRRDDVVQELLADQNTYQRDEIDNMIRHLHRVGLIYIKRGRYSTIEIA
ncbi:MAG: hypothetical protein WA183_11750 [Chthoniobacterales bacterium]